MKEIEIPQEKNDAQDGQRKVMYAPNKSGEFEKFKYGSSVEEYATKLAVQEYEVLKEEALQKIKKGTSSPIEYFMYNNRMDLPTLASVTGLFQFRIKRHLQAKIFKKLNDSMLARYALAFNIDIKELKEFNHE